MNVALEHANEDQPDTIDWEYVYAIAFDLLKELEHE